MNPCLNPDHEKRMAAAWTELGQRMTQRQSVIQIYMTVVIAIFGFYFSQQGEKESFPTLAEFFLLSITMITFISSALIGVHDRVISKLKRFMATCEQQAYLLNKEMTYVFYFSDGKFLNPNDESPTSFHNWNQYAQKGAFFATFLACNMTAIILAASNIEHQWIVMVCFTVMLAGLTLLMAFEFIKNRHVDVAIPAEVDNSTENRPTKKPAARKRARPKQP